MGENGIPFIMLCRLRGKSVGVLELLLELEN
jgi:hypothetical protein